VLDLLVDGLAGGGIRMRAGVTAEEVAGLARAMTHKKALAGALGGGAKGGIDLDPADPRAGAVLRRYVEAMRPLLRTCWSAAGDLGVSEAQLASVFAELGLGLTVQPLADRMPDPVAASAAIAAALGVTVAGIPLGDWTAGYGAAHAAAAALVHDGRSVARATVAVQGFGPVGSTAALALRDLGAHVIAVADADGLLVDAGGLDLDVLLAARGEHGRLDRAALPAAYEQRPGEEWLALDVDVLVPAAVAAAIDAEGSDRVRAAVVVEAANLPTTAAAQGRLTARAIRVVPDIVANAGTTAWFTWLATGEITPEAEPTFARLRALMAETVPLVLERADAERVTTHEAARRLAEHRLAERVAATPPGREQA
jgi:glutamate dehydrogenase (NAD(P)+)